MLDRKISTCRLGGEAVVVVPRCLALHQTCSGASDCVPICLLVVVYSVSSVVCIHSPARNVTRHVW